MTSAAPQVGRRRHVVLWSLVRRAHIRRMITSTKMMTTKTPMMVPITPLFMMSSSGDKPRFTS